MAISIAELTRSNFRADSLDCFVRHQEVTHCWRMIDGQWQLLPAAFTEDWSREKLRSEAEEILQVIDHGAAAYAAFDGNEVVGFVCLGEWLGSQSQYIELVSFHVSAPYRGKGIGRRLFAAVCDEARQRGAEKLYISAHSSKESQAAYHALGCEIAQEIDPVRASREPFDVQMEYNLGGMNQ